MALFTTFSLFRNRPGLLQAFSTRKGGVSPPPYAQLNLGLHTGDRRENVLKNRAIFFDALPVPKDRLVFPEQVHSDHVQLVKKPGMVPACDALITSQRNLFLTIQTADCFPVFLYDPLVQAVGIVHSGWRSTAKQIVAKTIRFMEAELQAKPERLLAAIGPGVQQACYQVDKKTASYFSDDVLLPDGSGHFKLDVQGAIVSQLHQAGVTEEHIERDKTCTHCAAELYYSYRRDGINSGRMMGVIGVTDS